MRTLRAARSLNGRGTCLTTPTSTSCHTPSPVDEVPGLQVDHPITHMSVREQSQNGGKGGGGGGGGGEILEEEDKEEIEGEEEEEEEEGPPGKC